MGRANGLVLLVLKNNAIQESNLDIDRMTVYKELTTFLSHIIDIKLNSVVKQWVLQELLVRMWIGRVYPRTIFHCCCCVAKGWSFSFCNKKIHIVFFPDLTSFSIHTCWREFKKASTTKKISFFLIFRLLIWFIYMSISIWS